MRRVRLLKHSLRIPFITLFAGLTLLLAGNFGCLAQSLPQVGALESRPEPVPPGAPAKTTDTPLTSAEPGSGRQPHPTFRVERVAIANGAELLTIFGKVNDREDAMADVPLLSIVRDTLGDNDPENDRLRYVWLLTYARPSLKQQIAAAIPFFYHRVGNRSVAPNGPPPPLLDIPATSRRAWSSILWFGVQHFVLDTQGIPLKLASRTYRQNASDYRTAHVIQALSILSMYDRTRPRNTDPNETLASLQLEPNTLPARASFVPTGGIVDRERTSPPLASPSISAADSVEARARLILSGRTLGALVPFEKYPTVVERRLIGSQDLIGHNWEMLRQRAEAERLYFEPLRMPDGTATHAILWVARDDVAALQDHDFDGRFLNIANPWKDERLRKWRGYVETRYFDSGDRQTTESSAGAHAVQMIPLAVYGLDNPKIPTLLVDFRDSLNPKKREVSRRVVREVTSNILSLSPVNYAYFLGRRAFDWVTNRRGMDLNQPTRIGSYSQLKLLLSMNSTIAPTLRHEIERRVEVVSPDPLTNDRAVEVQLARQQYDALTDFAERPDGMAAKIDRERRAEMVPLKHGRTAQLFFRMGTLFTFGRYVHRETATPELLAKMETARRAEYHLHFLRQAADSTPQIEVTSNLSDVKRSLQFLVDNSGEDGDSAAKVAARVFSRTEDTETRRLCIDALSRIKGKSAKNELLRIYRDAQTSAEWRTAAAESLRKAVSADQKLTPSQARALLNQIGGN